jgi:hypothetical protein
MSDADSVSLADLGITEDPGTAWHPRPDKAEAWNPDGTLRDLDDDEVAAHRAKPEARGQVDAGVEPLSAEDSAETPHDHI